MPQGNIRKDDNGNLIEERVIKESEIKDKIKLKENELKSINKNLNALTKQKDKVEKEIEKLKRYNSK